jgi:hypothetical protein
LSFASASFPNDKDKAHKNISACIRTLIDAAAFDESGTQRYINAVIPTEKRKNPTDNSGNIYKAN